MSNFLCLTHQTLHCAIFHEMIEFICSQIEPSSLVSYLHVIETDSQHHGKPNKKRRKKSFNSFSQMNIFVFLFFLVVLYPSLLLLLLLFFLMFIIYEYIYIYIYIYISIDVSFFPIICLCMYVSSPLSLSFFFL